MGMAPPKTKKELQVFFRIVYYLGKFSPSTTVTCESPRNLRPTKTERTLNTTYQMMFEKVKSTIKEDVCMKFYDETKPLYVETDASGVGLGAPLLQTRIIIIAALG